MWTSPLLRLVWSSVFHLQPSRDLQKSSLKPGHNSNNNMDLELRKLRRSILLRRRSKRSAWDQCADDAFKPNGWVRLRKDDIKKSANSLRRVLRKREMLRSMENTGQQFFNSRVRALHQEMRKLIILSNAVFLDMKFCPPMKKSLAGQLDRKAWHCSLAEHMAPLAGRNFGRKGLNFGRMKLLAPPKK